MMELRERIARAICGNWIVGDDRPWQQWTEEADAVLEVLAKQEPVAWLDDGTCRSGSHGTTHRVITDATKRDMPPAIADSFATPLYAAPGAQAAPVWQNCPTHGRAEANAWGCPECVREMRDEIQRLRAAVLANHEWHQRTDDYGGYPESEICEINTAALAAEPKPGDANAAL